MALTDHITTTEELQAAYTANPALKDVVLASIKPLGYTAYTEAERQALLDAEIGKKTSELYTGLDNDIFAASGLQKEGTEKTYDYAKRVIGGLKAAATPLQNEIADLKKKLSEGSGDATMRAQLEALQTKEQQYQKDLSDRDTQLFQKDVKLDVRDGLRELSYDQGIKESVRKVLVDNATQTIVSLAKVQENADGTKQIVYVENGKTKLNKAGQPADAAYLLRELLADVLAPAGHQGAGGGAGGDGGNAPRLDSAGKVVVPDVLPADVKTKGDLVDYLTGLGVKRDASKAAGTDDFDVAYAKLGAKLPLR